MRFPLVLLAALALTACQQPAANQPVQATASTAPSASPVAAGFALVTGSVKAPAGIIPTGGGNVIPTGGGNFIPTGGGNVVPAGGGSLRSLQAVAESPLTGTEVFLADAAGQRLPSLPGTTTDANGQFTFAQVPAGYTYMVVAKAHDSGRNKEVTLQTLVAPSALGATTAIDTASSLVTLAVTEGQGGLGQFNAAAFRTATEATAKNLADGDVPDLSDRSAILAKVDQLSRSIAELKTALDAIKQDLRDIKQSLDDLKNQLAAQQQQQAQQPPQQQPPPPPPAGGPPPQGVGGPRNCYPPVTFEAVLQMSVPAERYPLTLEFRPMPDGGPALFTGTFQAPGQTATVSVPPNCGHFLTLRGRGGAVIATSSAAWTPPPGAGDATHQRVNLPFTL